MRPIGIMRGTGAFPATALIGLTLLAGPVYAQRVRFVAGDREINPPERSSFRIGPFYSHFQLTQSAGFRYTDGTTNSVDVLTGDQRSAVKQNGFDIPLVTTAHLMNYLQISRHIDVDASLWCSYAFYPLRTQDNIFQANVLDPELLADIGTTVEVPLSSANYLRFGISDRPAYLASYVNRRGDADDYGGLRYNRFENDLALSLDWIAAADLTLLASAHRTDVMSPSEAFRDQEQTAHKGDLSLEYTVNPLIVAGIAAGGGTVAYTAETRGDFKNMGGRVFTRAELSKETRTRAAVGYAKAILDATNGGTRVESGIVTGELALENDFSKHTRHSLAYNRALVPNFYSGIEHYDNVSYSLNWQRNETAVGISMSLRSATTVGDTGSTGYRNWGVQLTASRMLSESTVAAFHSSYETVWNRWNMPGDANLVPELAYDYSTWGNKVELRHSIMANLDATLYASHITRSSEANVLTYRRFTIGAECKYTYEY